MAQKKYLDETGLGVLVSETKNYVNAKRVILTQAQYDALPSTKLTDGVEYCITDAAVVPGNTASNIGYSNTTSGLQATNVQAAIDEVVSEMGGGTAEDITYDNTDSGMQATDVQDAIDELSAGKANGEGLTFFVRNNILCVTDGNIPPEIVSFATATDQQIAGIINAYYDGFYTLSDLQSVWHVGDTRVIHLNEMQAPNPDSSSTWDAQDITITILDFNHTDLATPINGHSKAAVTLQTREVLNNNASGSGQAGHIYVNGDSSYDTTFTKWSNLYIRTYMNNIIYNAFPNEIKSMIKPSNHYRHTTYNGTASEQVTDNLFLPSYPEIFGTASYDKYAVTNPVEGTQFTYYQTATNRIKYGNNNGSSNGVAQSWWEGSPSYNTYSSDYGYRWCSVAPTGSINYGAGIHAFGLAPAFCF